MHGASQLRARLGFHRAHICPTHALLDNDEEGRKAVADAQALELLADSEYHVTGAKGMKNSEIEDLLAPSAYKQKLEQSFGVVLQQASLDATDKKWSERIRQQFLSNGKIWNSTLEAKIKKVVADQVEELTLAALHPNRKDIVSKLVQTLEQRLKPT